MLGGLQQKSSKDESIHKKSIETFSTSTRQLRTNFQLNQQSLLDETETLNVSLGKHIYPEIKTFCKKMQ